MDSVIGKGIKRVKEYFHKRGWYTNWDEESNILSVYYTGAGVVVDSYDIHFSGKLRATKVIIIRKNGYPVERN